MHSILIKHLTHSLIIRWESRGKALKKHKAPQQSQEKQVVVINIVEEKESQEPINKEEKINTKKPPKEVKPKETKTTSQVPSNLISAKGRQRKSTNLNQDACYVCETEVQNELICEICRRKCHMFCACVVKKKKEWYCQLCS